MVDGANGGEGTVEFTPFLTQPSADSSVCDPHGAPAMDITGLALLALGLLALPAWRLSRPRAG